MMRSDLADRNARAAQQTLRQLRNELSEVQASEQRLQQTVNSLSAEVGLLKTQVAQVLLLNRGSGPTT